MGDDRDSRSSPPQTAQRLRTGTEPPLGAGPAAPHPRAGARARGGAAGGGDGISGDGAGVMTQIPWELFKDYCLEDCRRPGVGMVFVPQEKARRDAV